MSDVVITEEVAQEVNSRLEELYTLKQERKESAENSVFAENLRLIRETEEVEEEEHEDVVLGVERG